MAADINGSLSKEYSLVETKRHKPCLIYRGHRYVQDKIQNRTIYWRCEDRSHCNGRAHQLVGNESLPILTIKHNHPAIVEDLSRHDIVIVDSHRRRRRQNRKIPRHQPNEKDDLLLSSAMTSPIKLENHQNKPQCLQQQQGITIKNLHLSEVITTASSTNAHHSNSISTHRHSIVDSNEMTKLLSNITTSINYSLKTSLIPLTMDDPSCLHHFSWEEIEGRYLPVIFRNENDCQQRYTSKTYVEHTLFQSESWQRHSVLAHSLSPLTSYSYTENELKLFRSVVEWHLASFHCKTIPSSDCLIRFEDLLDFYNELRKLRDSIPTPSLNRPIAPAPSTPKQRIPSVQAQSFELPIMIGSSIKKPSKTNPEQNKQLKTATESGWVQINNVFVPYIVKIKLRENDLTKCHTRPPASQLQREFYVPYEILIKCHIFSDNEFTLKKYLIKATQRDFDILNNLITDINIFDEKVPEKTFLVNLHHVMIGLNRILYIKFLPTKQPRTQVNKYHADVLTHKGGTLLFNGNKLIPYIVQNNRFYVPLLYTYHSLPNILLHAKRSARAPRQYEIEYLNLLFIYFSIETLPLTSDTLLVDVFNIKCSNLQSPIHFRTLHEHQQYEKNKLLNATVRSPPSNKSTGASSTQKTNKCPPANVVVNPMIHHPSFYGLPSPNSPLLPQKTAKQPEIKTIIFDKHSFHAVVSSFDVPVTDWKISMKEIFEQFSFDIDYQKFIRWCQINLLVPLIKLDEEENKIVNHNYDDDYYVYQRHLERCIALLNDLKRGSISMTLLPSEDNESQQQQQQQQQIIKSQLAGARKRKTTVPITRHINPAASTINETNALDIENPSPELAFHEESTSSVTNDISIKSPHNQITDDDDDRMPVVATVEGEQILEDFTQSDVDTSLVIVESTDYDDEKIHLENKIPSCSSGYESSAALVNIDTNIHGDDDDEINCGEHSSTIVLSSPKISSKNRNKNRRRTKNGNYRSRSRSLTARKHKKQRLLNDQSSAIRIITSDEIEQHLRTLFMSINQTRRTRTRPIKTPTRLVEEVPLIKSIEPDTNVFDILASSTMTDNNEQTINSPQSCTYNVIVSNKPNLLGLTIKKVVQQ